MLYRDLVQFKPIEPIIKLREAVSEEAARELVTSYVISDRMASSLKDLVLPQLDLDHPRASKGVLVVGNYGTGKSHLMSVIAAVAEFPDMTAFLTDPGVASAVGDTAGRYKVVRVELGAVERSLRDILFAELSASLANWETPYRFPSSTEANNNKDPLIEAVAAFHAKFPHQGILLVVDELLDFLRTRDERELILDLGFLREVGEVSSETSLRFIGGLQETLFDSPRFAFVADQLRRVRDRFQQVPITKEDIAYVISHRLLNKTDEQLAWISNHLRKFEPLYDGLSERMNEFADLFPIHPAYIDTFEDISIAEKRQVLQTFSRAIESRLDQEVPDDQPGVVSFDHYWSVLKEDIAVRSVPEVREVVDRSDELQGIVLSGYTRPHLLPMALRIIDALSVFRLATDDINVPVGLTPAALRDALFLFQRMPEMGADFLLRQVTVALEQIMRTVQGQYISHNEANGQYYIDVKKSVDFDTQVQTRAEMLGDDVLNRYAYDALAQTLQLNTSSTYVTNFRIWFYELPWSSHRVTRPGYLFLGKPDDRSTAQPPRDFYLYVLPPFGRRDDTRRDQSDEVLYRLVNLGDTFRRLVSLYAGARELAANSAQYRSEYADKAEGYLRQLAGWFREHLVQHLEVTYEGATQSAQAILAETRSTASESVREILDICSAHFLEPAFEDAYPEYPHFGRTSADITHEARANTALQTVRGIAGFRRTALVDAVLDGLKLLDAQGEIRPYDSPYAQHLLQLLESKGDGQVVNRGEVIATVAGSVDRPVEKDLRFMLEPEWVAVVMAALVHSGDIEVTYGSKKIDSGNIRDMVTMSLDALTDFRHYTRPPSVPVGRWADIFQALGLRPGLIRDETARDQGVRELQGRVNAELQSVTTLEHKISQGLRVWNASVFTDGITYQIDQGMVIGSKRDDVVLSQLELLPSIRAWKQLLQSLQPYDTVGKLRNLRVTPVAVTEGREGRDVADRAAKLAALVDDLQASTTYLAMAEDRLPAGHALRGELSQARQELLTGLRKMGRGEDPVVPGALPGRLADLKQRYIDVYADEHARLVLGPADDQRRESIMNGESLRQVLALNRLNLLPSGDLESWKQAITSLKTCRSFHPGLLADRPDCPYCTLNPSVAAQGYNAQVRLLALDEQLDRMLANWQGAVVSALESERARQSLANMTPAERSAVESFLAHPEEPVLPPSFVEAANKALRGIESMPISVADLEEALREGGLPCTVQEMRERFARFMLEVMRGRDESNTRLTVE